MADSSPSIPTTRIVEPLRCAYRVQGYDCGYGGPLRVLSIANFLQETAGFHADRLGVGMAAMAATGKTWMLSRIDLRVRGTPSPGEGIEVRTWPAGLKGIFALRDLRLSNPETGAVYVDAVYAYLVVDIASRRLLRPDRCFGEGLPRCLDPHPVPDFDFSIPDPRKSGDEPTRTVEGIGPAFTMKASPRHIDHNGHVNNAHLIDWLVDAVPREARGASGGPSSLRVEFLAEMLEGESVEALCYPASGSGVSGESQGAGGGSFCTELLREGVPVARALTVWG